MIHLKIFYILLSLNECHFGEASDIDKYVRF